MMSTTKEEKTIDLLYDHVETISSVMCTKCNKIEHEHDLDMFEASESFYHKGWYVTVHGNVYCPECNKKRK